MDLQSILQPMTGPIFSAAPPSSIPTSMAPSSAVACINSSNSSANTTSAPVRPAFKSASSRPASTTTLHSSSHPPPHISFLISSPEPSHPLTPLSATYHTSSNSGPNPFPSSHHAPGVLDSSSASAAARHPVSKISNLVHHSPPGSAFPFDQPPQTRASSASSSKGEQKSSISPILNPTNRSPMKTSNSYSAYSNPSLPASPPSVTSSIDQHPREFTKKRSLSDEDVAWQLIRLGNTSSSDHRNSDSTSKTSSTHTKSENPNSGKLPIMSKTHPLVDPHQSDSSICESLHSFSKRRRSNNSLRHSSSQTISSFQQLTSNNSEDNKELSTNQGSENLSNSHINTGSFPTYFDSSSFSKSRCSRCRRSKKGCDRQRPCGRCRDAGLNLDECVSDDEPSNVGGRKSKGRGRGRPKTRN
ncbi:DNA-binding transcription factor [Schizosaccharomyces osmophilus]|uniref:DNA-binding transcription factor n=1 Tax=Schizosaccharomyces osmophilus TaxID=2545709 RepID=A0AAE9WAA1_9SCHI|nr:DNA-binding transcription factor [Schizosaccharomyces osmophilus]WBW71547.1 DNA-binding transcription factor [Schizosaccharomyces osmophilus]